MLLGTTTFSVLQWGSLVVGVLGIIFWIAWRDIERAERAVPASASNIPPATIAGASAWRHTALRIAPFAMMVVGFGGAYLLHDVNTDVAFVRDDTSGDPHGSGLVVERRVYLGDVGATCKRVTPGTTGGWVVNEASREVRVERAEYGTMSLGRSTPREIPPGRCRQVGDLDYVGPDDVPPTSVELEGVEAELKMSSRNWLTWDR